ncbi:REP element-mobilizing transposase RayT [Lewinella marina]|uniref:Transposase IS200-like domain-containing protein n=1 Tax=Neolewinella marina TaxID=438751 RepID=A0A2G0CEU6_9BACT|nr:transposase [Neolewinella marina]NJB85833.1 REP element-mobilizing transposase RayT [Neolewinella marina]PHK98498.1 hypothetical protein CGL56_08450 [Neolewinella marina]
MEFKNCDITRDAVHIIYRLHGSIPQHLGEQLAISYRRAREAVEVEFGIETTDDLIEQQKQDRLRNLQEEYQLRYDQLLDRIQEGPRLLEDPEIKQLIIDQWLFNEQRGLVEVYAISVMSNHVHVLLAHPDEYGVTPFRSLLEAHKRYTARLINKKLDRPGRRVWASKAFDRD